MTVVSFTLADVQALDRVLRVMSRLDDIGGVFEEPVSPNRDAACERLESLSGRMLASLDNETAVLPSELDRLLVDTQDHSKAAEFRLVRGGRCV